MFRKINNTITDSALAIAGAYIGIAAVAAAIIANVLPL